MSPTSDPNPPGNPPRSGSRASRPASKPGLMRNLGQFFGHVVNGVKSDAAQEPAEQQPPAPPRHIGPGADSQPPANIVRHEVIERVQETPGGPVKIRRTIIEEEQVADDVAPPERPSC